MNIVRQDFDKGVLEQLLAAQAARDPHAEATPIRALSRATRTPVFTRGRSDLERFWVRVGFGVTDCWFWTGALCPLGYGVTGRKIRGEHRAHRLAYRLFKGEIPEGMKVLHSCDVRCCVNPDHLRIGTQADNVRDMVERGRWRCGDVSGERNGNARLTQADIAEMRRLSAAGIRQSELARRFGMSPMAVSRVVRGLSWK